MARRKLIAGNWKLNLTVDEGIKLVEALKPAAAATSAEVLVCPTFLGVAPAIQAAKGSKVQVGAQNCYVKESGAFTGEVSASLLKAAGVTHVILGHSERRQFFGDTDQTINQRLLAVQAQNLIPVFCIGETLQERQGGKLEAVLTTQIRGGLAGVKVSDASRLVVAYEPVWAIGTGRAATPEGANAVIAQHIRGCLADLYSPAVAQQLRVQYGGSVTAANAVELMTQPDIDGALVGGASLKPAEFGAIARAANR
jgi:triosephosphate isomerase